MILVVQNSENFCVFIESSGRRAWERVAKWSAIITNRADHVVPVERRR
jgi:hypothetical protein